MHRDPRAMLKLPAIVAALWIGAAGLVSAATPESVSAGRKQFEASCALCHGGDAAGGDRGPSLVDPRRKAQSEADLRTVIREGIPAGGMPNFVFSDQVLQELVDFITFLNSPAASQPVDADTEAGKQYFFGSGRCLNCHMLHGSGGLTAPDLTNLADRRKLAEIEAEIRTPSARIAPGFEMALVRTRDGRTVRGFLKNESSYDLQVVDLDGMVHLWKREDLARIEREPNSLMPDLQLTDKQTDDLLAFLTRLSVDHIPAAELAAAARGYRGNPLDPMPGHVPFERALNPKPGDWLTYHGSLSGNRHSPLTQINTTNVATLAPQWMYPMEPSRGLQTTPVVVDGIMYVTTANECHALDAATGRMIWSYTRPRTQGLVGDPTRGIVRGVALHGDKVFMLTDNARLLALHRINGNLLWEADLVGNLENKEHYGSTSAPLVVGDKVIAGISGGDGGIRGFLDAYNAEDGSRAWRFWTVPLPGEPLSDTWKGEALVYACGSTWLTGSYDPELNLLYWTTGNPCPDFNGDERKGDNLYSDSILALNPDTGKLIWHYQYTPHDLWDYDAQQPVLLIDTELEGRPRKVLAHANRNGFFYVLDRTNGELLVAKPYVDLLNWADGIGADGRPKVRPEAIPGPEGTRVCPSPIGATNWMSTSYSPQTGLFYVTALEECATIVKSSRWFKHGEQFIGGYWNRIPEELGKKYVRAINVQTGERVWDFPQVGPGTTLAGLISTDGGLVFFGDDGGAFAAVDAKTGKPLWHFHANHRWRSSPMTYLADGRQFVAVAMGSYIMSFGLPEPAGK